MQLHVEHDGHGPEVVLVHGWGMHSGVWSGLATQLAHHYRVTTVDLPGHGRSIAPHNKFTLADLTRTILDAVPSSAAWVGWSLGGLASVMAAYEAPERVAKLVLVGATPRFVNAQDWEHGMSADVLQAFANAVANDRGQALERFVALQFGSDTKERAGARTLRAELQRVDMPAPLALQAGLDILRDTDARALLPQVTMPTLVVHGAQDRIAPLPAGAYLASTLPQARLYVMKDAGHAPFMSYPAEFSAAVEEFLRG